MGRRSAFRKHEAGTVAYVDTSRERTVRQDFLTAGVSAPTLEHKVEFLSRFSAYAHLSLIHI